MSEHRLTKIRLFPVLLIAIGVILLLGSLGYGYYTYTITNPGNAPLPETLAGLPLKAHVFGGQAVDEINQLHGLTFPLSSGAVGVYGDQSQATLWISGAPSKSMAAQLTADMEARIAEGNSPFTPTNEYTDHNRTIYELDGHGQKHYYFQSGKLAVWLAADVEIAENALAEVVVFYP